MMALDPPFNTRLIGHVVAFLFAMPLLAQAAELPRGVSTVASTSGLVLASEDGHPLYRLDLDRGRRGRPSSQTVCSDKCAQLWAPLPPPPEFKPGGDWGIKGSSQLTYKGAPLYRFKGKSLSEAAALRIYPPYLSGYSAKPALLVDGVPITGIYWHEVDYRWPPPTAVAPASVSIVWKETKYVFVDAEGDTLVTCSDPASCTSRGEGVKPLEVPLAAHALGDWRPQVAPDGSRFWTFEGKEVFSTAPGSAESGDWSPIVAK